MNFPSGLLPKEFKRYMGVEGRHRQGMRKHYTISQQLKRFYFCLHDRFWVKLSQQCSWSLWRQNVFFKSKVVLFTILCTLFTTCIGLLLFHWLLSRSLELHFKTRRKQLHWAKGLSRNISHNDKYILFCNARKNIAVRF